VVFAIVLVISALVFGRVGDRSHSVALKPWVRKIAPSGAVSVFIAPYRTLLQFKKSVWLQKIAKNRLF
jgi:hypothetical protein